MCLDPYHQRTDKPPHTYNPHPKTLNQSAMLLLPVGVYKWGVGSICPQSPPTMIDIGQTHFVSKLVILHKSHNTPMHTPLPPQLLSGLTVVFFWQIGHERVAWNCFDPLPREERGWLKKS